MDNNTIQSILQTNFDELTFESTLPVIVYFAAERCKVCKALLPVVEELALDYTNRVKIYSVDVDKNDTLVKRFRLQGIPTLLIFKDGEVMDKIAGFQPKILLDNRIDVIINSKN